MLRGLAPQFRAVRQDQIGGFQLDQRESQVPKRIRANWDRGVAIGQWSKVGESRWQERSFFQQLCLRCIGDFSVAAGLCASLLKPQDVHQSWFVNHAIMTDWLR